MNERSDNDRHMGQQENNWQELLRRYAQNDLNAVEAEQLFRWIVGVDVSASISNHDQDVLNELQEMLAKMPPAENYEQIRWNNVMQRALALASGQENDTTRKRPAVVRFLPVIRKVAIAVAVIAFSGYWLLLYRPESSSYIHKKAALSDALQIKAPVSSKAVLELEDGIGYVVDSLASKSTNRIPQITRQADGMLVYNKTAPEKGMHKLVNPRGSNVVSVQLSDGTRVWLNAESNIRYPAVFEGSKREVEVSGEVYLEVSTRYLQNNSKGNPQKMPFLVKVVPEQGEPSRLIEVLGTHFNVRSYVGAPVKVTLLEGLVNLRSGTAAVQLNPGEQGIFGKELQKNSIRDPNAAIAWKNGFLSFSYQSIAELASELSRWYDISIEWNPSLSERRFGGGIERAANLQQVIRILEESKIKCRLEGRTLYLN